MKNQAAVHRRANLKQLAKSIAKAQERGEPLKSLEQLDDLDDIEVLQVFDIVRVDDVSDEISVTIEGRMFAGMVVGDVPDFGPGKVAEATGTISETELAARYLESKVHGVERAIRENGHLKDQLEWLGRVLKITADEFRQQLHIPSIMIDGKVIPYNEESETGIRHEANMLLFFSDVHERNVRAGWWSDLETGEPLKRNVGELFMLFVTEIVEAYDAYILGSPDDKLPDYPGLGVELGDLAIRMADFAGAAAAGKLVDYSGVRNPGELMFDGVRDIAYRYEAIRKTPEAKGDIETGDFLPKMNIGEMIDKKLAFNASREDHKVENRLKPDGKKT